MRERDDRRNGLIVLEGGDNEMKCPIREDRMGSLSLIVA